MRGPAVLLALGAALCLARRLLQRLRRALPAEGKAVLITGCDKGFGHALAKQLHAKGFTVFAGCLLADKNGDGARELKDMKSDRMKVLQMNVCSDQEVAQAVDYVKMTLKDPEEALLFVLTAVYGCIVLCFSNFTKCGLRAKVFAMGTPTVMTSKGQMLSDLLSLGHVRS